MFVKRSLAGAAAFVIALWAWCGGAAAQKIDVEGLRQNLFSTCFNSATEGWAVGDLGRIFHTSDGGKTWEVQNAGTKRPFSSISCIGSDLWAAGQSGQIAHSSDGGKTWKAQNSNLNRQ